ncbi:hypothetical protein HHA04nite_27450 [Halomonas halophila]|uniref:Uncharacterized protein n=1 Tax=Halomonas halophila TaxID=29573 RepID=A0ABQ0U6Z2_9GAMM|nr:hypothetical protein HHA04nite_27450 [Halomonas halophila]
MRVSTQDKEVRDICHIMDLQVARQMNLEQAEQHWRRVIQNVPPETVALALAVKLSEYDFPPQSGRRAQP